MEAAVGTVAISAMVNLLVREGRDQLYRRHVLPRIVDRIQSRHSRGRAVLLNDETKGWIELRSSLERGALRRRWREHSGTARRYVMVEGTMYRYVPIFAAAFEEFEKFWCEWLASGRPAPLGETKLDLLRYWYLLSLFQWGFSAQMEGTVECKSGRYHAVGLAQVDEINGVHVMVSPKAWPRLTLSAGQRARQVILKAQIGAVDKEFKQALMDGVLGKLDVDNVPGIGPEILTDIKYVLFIDEPEQIVASHRAEFFSAYVWVAFETPTGARYAVWEHANIASNELFDHAVAELVRKAHDVYRTGDKLVAWVEPTVRDAVANGLFCSIA